MDAGETVLHAAQREMAEEVGAAVQARPLGVAHVATFSYDHQLPHMISITYLMAYTGGDPIAGDDMQGSQLAWVPLQTLIQGERQLLAPLDQPWLLQRVQQLFRLWHGEPENPLQPPLSQTAKNKYNQEYQG